MTSYTPAQDLLWHLINFRVTTAQTLDDHVDVEALMLEGYDAGLFIGMSVPTHDQLIDHCAEFIAMAHPEHASRAAEYTAFFARKYSVLSDRDKWGCGHYVTWSEFIEQQGE